MEENKEDEASQTISSSEFDCVSDCSYQFPREQESLNNAPLFQGTSWLSRAGVGVMMIEG